MIIKLHITEIELWTQKCKGKNIEAQRNEADFCVLAQLHLNSKNAGQGYHQSSHFIR